MARRKLSELSGGTPAAAKGPEDYASFLKRKIPAASMAARFLTGAGKTIAETGPIPLARVLANMGVPGASKVMEGYQKSNEGVELGDAGQYGGMAGDLLANAAVTTATGGAGLVVPALQMAAGHGLQNYAKNGEVNLGDVALDAGTGIALGAAGKKLGPALKSTGNRILENVVKPSGRYAGVNLEPVLASARGIGKYFEGLGKLEGKTKKPISGMVKRVGDDVSKNAKSRLQMMRKADVKGDFNAASQATEKAILGRNAELGQRGLTEGEKVAALNASKEWAGTTPNLTADELQGLIQKSDDMAYQAAKDINLAPKQTYSRELGRSLRGQREDGINLAASTGKLSPEDLLSYKGSKKTLQELKPAFDAIAYRSARPNYGGSLVKDFNPFGIPLGRLADKAITRPGTANLAYDLGRVADADASRWLGRKGLDLARSAQFSPNQGK